MILFEIDANNRKIVIRVRREKRRGYRSRADTDLATGAAGEN
jgi:hypothetical protein